jgi:tRNA nucleotidyltransferase (CCA-adding enzyme)
MSPDTPNQPDALRLQAGLAMAVAAAVRERGGRALLVGGCVRDELLGRTPKDLDMEVFGLEGAALRSLLDGFGRVDVVGESFSVYKIGGLDVALPRRESRTGRGHKGFSVDGDPSLSVPEAARRRDFTINAISRDPLTDEILDPFGGQQDLYARRLRVIDRTTFSDDSLRVLRALQFAARFDLEVDADTREILRSIPLDDLPAERVWGEVEKLLLQPARPSIGFTLARDIGVVERLWPEMHALIGCEQEPEWHPEGDVWIHTLLVIDEARQRLEGLDRGRAAAIMLGAITHDFGKPLTTAVSDGRIRSIGHEEAGVPPATAFLDRLNIHTLDGFDVRTTVLGMVAHHLKPGMFRKSPTPVGDGAFRRLAQKVDLELLARLAEADCNGRTGTFDCSAMRWFLERARALGVEHEAPKPIVLGRHLLDLGVAPGPGMGLILKEIYERQLDGAVASLEEGIALARVLLRERAERD